MLVWSITAAASEPEEIVVEGVAPTEIAAGSAQVTVIVIDDTFPSSADVATAVQRAPGVAVRRLGGLGDAVQVGIRGADSRHTEVLLDGIPLNPEGGSAVDLSELPLWALQRVEVYRGAAPALLGSTGLGGAISLVTSDAARSRLDLGGGSFGTARGAATLAGPIPTGSVLFDAAGLATQGRFSWFDDRGTRFDPSDDGPALRENNEARQLGVLARGRTGPLTVLHSGFWRDEGVPGFTFAPTEAVRLATQRHLLGARLEGDVGATGLSARAYGVSRVEQFDDRAGEIGVGSQWTTMRSGSLGVDGGLRTPLSSRVRLDLGVGGRLDRYVSTDRLLEVDATPRSRSVVRGVASVPFGIASVEGIPTVIVLALTDADAASLAPGRAFVLPRGGAVARLGAVTLKANLGAFARPPDPVELFGDRGALVGNPALEPERGVQADLGVGAAGGVGTVNAAVFSARYRDFIVWTPGAQGVAMPENLDRANVTGVELAASADVAPLDLGLTATLQHAANRSDDPVYAGNQLPRVPVAEALGTVWFTHHAAQLGADLSVTAGTYADTANFVLQPLRALLGATARLRDRSEALSVELDVRNVLDDRTNLVARDPLVDDGIRVPQPLVDFTGYPLPGRTFLLSVRATR